METGNIPHYSGRRDGKFFDTRQATRLTCTIQPTWVRRPDAPAQSSQVQGWKASILYRDYRGDYFSRTYVTDDQQLRISDSVSWRTPRQAERLWNNSHQLVNYACAFRWRATHRRAVDCYHDWAPQIGPLLTPSNLSQLKKAWVAVPVVGGVAWWQGWLHRIIVLVQHVH